MKQSGDVTEGLRGLAASNTGQREMVGAGEAVGGGTHDPTGLAENFPDLRKK